MAGPLSFDAYLGWVNITDPNNIPQDARVISADDLLRYEKLGVDAVAAVNGLAAEVDSFDADSSVAASVLDTASQTRAAMSQLVGEGVAQFQAVIDDVPTNVAEQVPPLVTTALAANGAPAAAAAAAVSQKLAEAGVVSGGGSIVASDVVFSITDNTGKRSWLEINPAGAPTANAAAVIAKAVEPSIDTKIKAIPNQPAQINDYLEPAFAITDGSDRRSWLEIAKNGGPTPHALSFLSGALNPSIVKAVADASPVQPVSELIGVAFSVTDGSDRRSDLELGFDGHITQRVIDLWSKRIVPAPPAVTYSPEVVGVSPNRSLYLNSSDGGRRLVSAVNDPRSAYVTPDQQWLIFEANDGSKATRTGTIAVVPSASLLSTITQWGDSLTQAGDVRTRLLELLPAGTVVNNRGIGGQTSTQIAARQGGIPAPVTLVGNSIPASGPVDVVSPPPVKFLFSYSGPNNKQGARSLTGTLAGVPGTMSMVAVPEFGVEQYVFTRTTPGSAVPVTAGTPFIFDDAFAQRMNTQILWTGRNNMNGPIVADTKGMVDFINTYTKRFLVLSVTTATTEVVGTQGYNWAKAANDEMAATYGDRFVDIRQHLVTNGLALAGITPTAEDNTAIAGNTIPPSLMNPGDSVHFNTTGQRIIADFIYARMQTKGWY